MPLTIDNEFERMLECAACGVRFIVKVLPPQQCPDLVQLGKAQEFIASITYCPHCGKATVEDVA